MRTTKDYTPEEIETRIAEAFKRAWSVFPASYDYAGGKWEQYAEAAGVDMNLAALSGFSLGYNVEQRLAFHLNVSFRFSIECKAGDPEPLVTCDVSWASGGGAPADAVAQASLHLETAQKAARCHLMVTDVMRTLRFATKADYKAFQAGRALFTAKVEAAHEAIQAEHVRADEASK